MLNLQETTYPNNYVKLRFLENHDNPRAKHIIPNEAQLLNWTAFIYFQKWTTLIYAGQEVEVDNCPSLFDYDKVNWSTRKDISPLIKQLYKIKKNPILKDGNYDLIADEKMQTIVGYYKNLNSKLICLFSLKGKSGQVAIELNDGFYTNLIDNEKIQVNDGFVKITENPIIISAN